MTTSNIHTATQSHGNLQKVFNDIYLVTGAMSIKGRLPLQFSRNMTIIQEDKELVLVNSIRLDEQGLASLEALGTVKHVIRLAGFHGMDDPFYRDRYGAKVWSVNAPYFKGVNFNIENQDGYFQPDVYIDEKTVLPIKNSKPVCINSSKPKEMLIYLAHQGGTLITGDSLQNWTKPDGYFNFPAKVIMRLMGFIKPCSIGPAWFKHACPDNSELKRICDLNFENLLPAHGTPVTGNAREKYLPAFNRI